MCIGDKNNIQQGPLSQARGKLLGEIGGVDMAAYQVYVREQIANGLKPLPPQAWAIAHKDVNR